MLMKYPDIQVVGTARNGREALSQVAKVFPDVMTLDVDMPEMNGLEVLDRVMAEHPIPVVMVSSLTHEGAEETFQALARGAFDFIPKQQRISLGDLGPLEIRLYEKIKSAFDNKERFLRITSYNVCYTKLLRLHRWSNPADKGLSRPSQNWRTVGWS